MVNSPSRHVHGNIICCVLSLFPCLLWLQVDALYVCGLLDRKKTNHRDIDVVFLEVHWCYVFCVSG